MGEKFFHFHRVDFEIFDFKGGGHEIIKKQGDQNFKIFNIIFS